MRKLLKKLYIIQEYYNKKRLNPYNPLSYLIIILVFIIGILMFGFVGFWAHIDFKNPFVWQ